MKNFNFLLLFISIFLNTQGFSQIRLDSGLVGYFAFDNNVVDSSVVGISGTPTNVTSVNGIHGVPNTAYNFNGINSKIEFTSDLRSITNTVTISLWIKTYTSVDNQFLVEKYNWNVDKGFAIFLSDGKATLQVRNTDGIGAFTPIVNSTTIVNDGNWHHLLGIVSGNSLQLWIDGNFEASESLTATNPDLTNSMSLSIGYNELNNSRYFSGDIDQVRIYNRTLNTQEIIKLSTKGSPTGINTTLKNYSLNLYPNPAQKVINITSKDGNVKRVMIFDMSGKVVFNETGNTPMYTVNVAHLMKGIYLVKVFTAKGESVEKLIIE